MIKVLHIFSYFRPDFTGEGIYLEKLANHLLDHDIETHVVASITQAPRAPLMNGALRGICFFGSPQPKRYLNYKMLTWFANNIRHYDVIHFHAWVDRTFLYHLFAFVNNLPIVHSCTLDDG